MIQNYLTMEYRKIGEILCFTERQIRGRLNNMGYTKRRKVNYDYFKNIDTPLKSYFLGFIYADGYVVYNETKSTYEFGMELQAGDSYILDKLNCELGNLNVIYSKPEKDMKICGNMCHKNTTSVLRVYSKELVINLIKNGIKTNKSKKKYYPIVNDNLFFDWLRGYIDGDGCFYYNKKNNIYMHITSAKDDVLKYIQDKLNVLDIKTTIYHYDNEKNKYRLMCTDKNSITKLVNHLYYEDDLFCLIRKYNIVKKLLCLTS